MAKTSKKVVRKRIKTEKRPNEKSLAEEIKKIDEYRRKEESNTSKKYGEIIEKYTHDRDKEKITPWLLIRNSTSDLGLRPIASGIPFWVSPDIWIESSNISGNPVEGEENFIHVRVHNLGAADAVPVMIDFYWADPSLGVGASNMNLVGTEWVEIRSLHSNDVRCNKAWVPQFLNNGHECIMVNCTNYILDPIGHPFEPVLDRHVGQRNVHVEKATAGQKISYQLKLNNISPFSLKHNVYARFQQLKINDATSRKLDSTLLNQVAFADIQTDTALELKGRYTITAPNFNASQKLRKILLNNFSKLGRKDLLFEKPNRRYSQLKIQSQINEKTLAVYSQHSAKSLADRLLAFNYLSDTSTCNFRNQITLHSIDMKPFEQRQLDLEIMIPYDAQPNELIILHISQDTEMFSAGGFTYIFQIIR